LATVAVFTTTVAVFTATVAVFATTVGAFTTGVAAFAAGVGVAVVRTVALAPIVVTCAVAREAEEALLETPRVVEAAAAFDQLTPVDPVLLDVAALDWVAGTVLTVVDLFATETATLEAAASDAADVAVVDARPVGAPKRPTADVPTAGPPTAESSMLPDPRAGALATEPDTPRNGTTTAIVKAKPVANKTDCLNTCVPPYNVAPSPSDWCAVPS
jgi:hypothetical protein